MWNCYPFYLKNKHMMKKLFFLLPLSALFFACDNSTNDDNENPKEPQEVVIGDPGSAYDDIKITTLEDRVAYSVGYNSTEDAREWLNSREFHPYFNRAKTRDGFFKGIEFADSVTAQEYNSYLMLYFQSQGSFDTTNIKPSEASYYMGYLRGYELKKSFEIKNILNKLPLDVLRKGYKDGLYNTEPLVALSEQSTVITEYFSSISKIEGQEFLDANRSKKGITTTKSGLQFEVLESGKGAKPTINSTVSVYYTLRDISYRILESNANDPKPISFPLGNVITGWQEGLQLMQRGGKYRLYVPYELAYGAQGAPPKIQPYATLIFEIELIDFE
jgi:FKBP-type peptidyl-prolyl cis-trans isomerase FklB